MNMGTAVGIIERRVNGLGVSEAEVHTQGSDNIIVYFPKGTRSEQGRSRSVPAPSSTSSPF
ncbi:Protein translocase subunit SecD [Streptomyces microflavus]